MKFLKTRLTYSPVILLATALTLSAGCTDPAQQGQQQSGADSDAATMSEIKAANASRQPKQNQGVVKSVETAGGYTYARVDVSGDEFWVATTMMALEPGAEVAWKDHAMMNNFKSKALGREFDQILFVDRLFNPAAQTATTHQGVVEEFMDSAGYSFIRVQENGKSIWLAAPSTRIEIGQSIQWSGGGQMRNFTSRSLDRVFEEITFVNAVHAS
ncbi:MAG: GW dipeptide domain-containing protein [Gammaproteobacteria bacterium]|nr:GW dipeptide domain-containing protein [Gammaproteobacteria bacterium]